MNPEIPKSTRDVLARQVVPDDHPSADLLTGFMEHALSPGENERVTVHLAACKDCREIVFLASAAEEVPEEELVAAPSPRYATAVRQRKSWTSWRWLAPALAALVVAAGVAVHYQNHKTQSAEDTTVAVNHPPASPQAQANNATALKLDSTTETPEKRAAETAPAPAKKSASADRLSRPLQPGPPAQAASEARDMAAAAPPVPPSAPSVAAGAAGLSPPKLSSPAKSAAMGKEAMGNRVYVQQSGDTARPVARALAPASAAATAGKPQASLMGGAFSMKARPAVAGSQWRITGDGHLEHSVAPDTWTRVLADQPVTFRTVAVVGSDVWAGGADGVLFHSSDGGGQWSPVVLNAGGDQERAAIVAIRFESPSVGRVTAEDGAGWTTSDGGKTWSKL